MLNLFIKSLIILAVMVVAVRFMGKRQLGEMQPFEFVITLLIANVASVPIADQHVPVTNGLIPILTLYLGHSLFVWLVLISVRLRRFVNGKPLTLITPDGIDDDARKKAHMSVNDLMLVLRQKGYYSPEQVKYAILETNGKVSVLTAENTVSLTELPYTLIDDGKIQERNLTLLNLNKFAVFEMLDEFDLMVSHVVLMTVTRSGRLYVQPRKGRYAVSKTELVGGF